MLCFQLAILLFNRDPNLWLVKCRMGEEKATVISLMRKFIAYQFTDDVSQFDFNNLIVIFNDFISFFVLYKITIN